MRLVFALSLVAAIAASLVGTLSAQPLPAEVYSVTSDGELFRIRPDGTAIQLATTSPPSEGITMSADNRGVLFAGYGNTLSSIAATVNEWRNGVATTMWSTSAFSIEELLVNQYGEVVFSGRDHRARESGVFKWRGGQAVSTIVTTGALGASSIFMNGGLIENVETGNYVVASGAFISSQLWDVSDDGTVTSLLTSLTYIAGAYTLTQDRRDGGIFRSTFGNAYQRVLNGTTTTLAPTGGTIPLYQALAMDRASAPDNARLLYSVFQSPTTVNNFVHRIQDPAGTPVVTSSTPLSRAAGGSTLGAVLAGSRNIGSRRNGPGAYTLYFDFPGEGGNGYAAAVGASGYHPGIDAGGLTIGLNLDPLVVASIQGLLRPFFDPGPGVLDANGSATGSIALGRDDLGVLVHVVALTIRGGAIRTVSSPHVMRL